MIEQMLAAARSRIARYTPEQAASADALILDLRSNDERARTGAIPGSLHVPRSVLEWRCDPRSGSANPCLAESDKPLILVCEHGCSSSLAAASLVELGIAGVGDLEGGFESWAAAGLPVVPAPEPAPGLPGMGGPA